MGVCLCRGGGGCRGEAGEQAKYSRMENEDLLPTGSEEREVLGVGSIPVALLPSCQYMEIIAL